MDWGTALESFIALLALAVSIFSYRRTNTIEKRIRDKSDKRDTFDSWISIPVELQLAALSQAVGSIAAAARRHGANNVERSAAISGIQNNEFFGAVDEFAAFSASRSDAIILTIQGRVDDLVDAVLDTINELDHDLAEIEVRELAKQLVRSKQKALSEIQADVRAERLALI